MLWNASVINGCAIAANDGRLGTVSDFLFDDASCWFVDWSSKPANGCPVAKSFCPVRLGAPRSKGTRILVELTMQQVKDSPDIDTDRPVSRQMETNIYDHYGWAPYWGKSIFTDSYGYVGGAMTASTVLGSRRREENFSETQRSDGRSASPQHRSGHRIPYPC